MLATLVRGDAPLFTALWIPGAVILPVFAAWWLHERVELPGAALRARDGAGLKPDEGPIRGVRPSRSAFAS